MEAQGSLVDRVNTWHLSTEQEPGVQAVETMNSSNPGGPLKSSTPGPSSRTQSARASQGPPQDVPVTALDPEKTQICISLDGRVQYIIHTDALGNYPGADDLGRRWEVWNLLTFTANSPRTQSRWEAHLLKEAGAGYHLMRQHAMEARGWQPLVPGEPMFVSQGGIIRNTSRIAHLTLRKSAGQRFRKADRDQLFSGITKAYKTKNLFLGSGTEEDPYRLAINLRTGKFTVQGVPKLELWDAICYPFNSRDQKKYWLLALMVDEESFDGVCTAAEANWRPETEESSEPEDLSGEDEEGDSNRAGPSARSSMTAVNSPGAIDPSTKRTRKSTPSQPSGPTVSFPLETSTPRGRSAPPKGILRHPSSTPTAEESSDEEEDTNSKRYEYSRREAEAIQRSRSSSRASSRTSSPDTSPTRHPAEVQRKVYPKGKSPRAKNARAQPVMFRPLAEGVPLKGKPLMSKTGLRWSTGLDEISDDSEGDLAGEEQGGMIPGYSATWENARFIARAPRVERVLSQPGLTTGYKQSYIQAGYENMKEQLQSRDVSVARMVREKNRHNLQNSEIMRNHAPAQRERALEPSYSQLPLGSGDYSISSQTHSPHSSDIMGMTQYIKDVIPQKEANESQSQYLRRIIECIPRQLLDDPRAAQALAQLRGLRVPKGCTLSSLHDLGKIRTPGLDPGEQLIEELLPKVIGKQIELTVAVAIIQEQVDKQRLTVTLEKLFTQLPGGYSLAVGCAHWGWQELLRECADYEAIGRMKNKSKNQPRTSENKKSTTSPKQQDARDPPTQDHRPKQNKRQDSKNGARGSSREDPPKQKKQPQKKTEKTTYYNDDEWAALSREQQQEIRAQRAATREAQESKTPASKE